jgi:hypothetical protein
VYKKKSRLHEYLFEMMNERGELNKGYNMVSEVIFMNYSSVVAPFFIVDDRRLCVKPKTKKIHRINDFDSKILTSDQQNQVKL